MAVAYDLTGSCAGTAPADGEVVPEAVLLEAVLLAVWFGTLVDVAPVIRGCVVGGGGGARRLVGGAEESTTQSESGTAATDVKPGTPEGRDDAGMGAEACHRTLRGSERVWKRAAAERRLAEGRTVAMPRVEGR